jgi:hypothetical protein
MFAVFTSGNGNQIEYAFYETASGEDISRREHRVTRVNTPNEGLVNTSWFGFEETFDSTVISIPAGAPSFIGIPIGQHDISLNRTEMSYKLKVSPLGNIVVDPVEMKEIASRKCEVTLDRLDVSFQSSRTFEPTFSNPAAVARVELVEINAWCVFDAWQARRSVKVNNGDPIVVVDAEDWPNSSGTGSDVLTDLVASLMLIRYFGSEYVQPNPKSPRIYFFKAIDDAPWSQSPWF